ncbi:hypothetical protein HON59_02030 [bacterium]|jgi:hypothetical protein|nr:hypothetical protein [Candidatus Woesearchaeota archaeon]MBT4733120.1 hypothetical protein [Candidatus Woesearchaeota archaeon]MBT4894822.1 hypothetical protein [bacterium]MBT7555545.1 hypothetical protein [Candidatus Woesearchaeota archaeon]
MKNEKISYLYHGAKQQNLTELSPFEAGHIKKYVYATSSQALALIFINRPGGSLIANWGKGEEGIPYYCEKIEGVLKKNYAGVKGSIYVVDKRLFSQDNELHNIEFVSKETVPVIKEIKIDDLEEYFKKLNDEGKVNIIYYEDRLKFFPNIDKETVESALKLIKKYGKDKILPDIQKYQPKILDEVLKRIN